MKESHMSEIPESGFLRRPHAAWLVLLLVGLTLALFGPARGFGYISLDDYLYVAENPMVSEGLTGEGVRQAFTAVREQWWLPLLWISYMADIEVFGAGPHGHHFMNILLHAANAGLLFWVLSQMTGARWRSAFVAALFAWHPLRVESVAWITERKDVLSGLFFMLVLLAYLRYVEKPSGSRMTAVGVLMLAGLMSKSILIILPPILLLLDYWPLARGGEPGGPAIWIRWKPLIAEKYPLIVLSAVFTVLTLVTHGTAGGEQVDTSWFNRLTLIAPNYGIYLGKIFWPIRLTIINFHGIPTPWWIRLLAPAALLGFTCCVWRFRKAWPFLLVGWLWFLIALFPVIRGIRFDEQSAFSDRYTYLPGIGIGLMLAWAFGSVSERWSRLRTLASLACGLILAACLARTPAQLGWWRNSLLLFGRAAYLAPESHVVRNSLGQSMCEAGRAVEGAANLQEALRLQPENAEYRSNLGVAMLRLGRPEDALTLHDEAIRRQPGDARFHNNRGNALAALGRRAEAEAAYGEALRLQPDHAEAHFNLGNLLFQTGRASEALPHYLDAVRGQPGLALNWYNLGITYAQLGRYAEATPCVERALQIDPELPGAKAALARLRMPGF